jgi:GNAT superfamily N-acetyltransferase
MRADDVEPAIAAIRDGGWGDRRQELRLYFRHAQTNVFVAEQDGGIVGTTIVTVSEGIGWIGLVFVAPALRGRGLGMRLTRVGLENAHQRGTRSVLLAASALGRPIYEKLGFAVDGQYAIMFGPGLASHDPGQTGLRAIEASDLPALSALDRAATSEDRTHLLRALGQGWVVDRDGHVRGYALRTPWGLGPAIAEEARDGRVLLDTLRADGHGGELRLMLPRDNTAAMRHLAGAGFREGSALPRMRLGDPVPWIPERIWATFNASFG